MMRTINKNQSTEQYKESSFWTVLFIGLLAITLSESICVSLHIYYSITIGNILAIVFGIFIIIGGSVKWGMGMIFAGIFAIAGSGAGGLFFDDYLEAKFGKGIKNIPINDVIEYHSTTRFQFTNGKILSQFTGGYTKVTTSFNSKQPKSTYSYFVAPIVSKDWNKSKPIYLWAGSEINPAKKDWEKDYKAGVRVSSQDLKYYHEAVKRAEQRYGIRSISNVPIVYWVSSPDDKLKEFYNMAWFFVLFWPGLWIIGFSLSHILFSNKNMENRN